MQKIAYLHRTPEPDPKVMSFFEHLEELRRRLIIIALVVLVGTVIGWFIEPTVLNALEKPLEAVSEGEPQPRS